MSTQYDNIGVLYNDMKDLPAAKLETANVRCAVNPLISGARVLDLACGTGFYSRALLSWGAKEVVGIDISRKMIEAAQDESRRLGILPEKLSFIVGDVSEPMTIKKGLFDVVLGAWLLNYAPNADKMTVMWRNIAENLRPGGHFVGVSQWPAPCPGDMIRRLNSNVYRKYGISATLVQEVQHGIKTHVVGHLQSGPIEFENFHLQKDIYEGTARKGGMTGEFLWKPVRLPKELSGAYESGFWDSALSNPHFGFCVVGR